MANSIEFAKNYAGILDEVYQRAAVSRCLDSGGRIVQVFEIDPAGYSSASARSYDSIKRW